MISTKFAALFLKMKMFPFTIQSDKHVKHFEPLSRSFFGVPAVRNRITIAEMSGTFSVPDNF